MPLPKSLSASSLQVANQCMKRWEASYIDRVSDFENDAANVGTAVHGALEVYVQDVHIDKTIPASLNTLIERYKSSYMETFKTADFDTDEYKDGLGMLKTWFKRNNFEGVEVVSCEVKKNIPIPVYLDKEIVKIPFNYIMDRVDKIGPNRYRVVDYKTVRVPLQPDDLRRKVQARAYALAIQIEYPDAEEVQVVFDLLRHDEVGIVVTREQNKEFWYYLKRAAQQIVDVKTEDIRPKLNAECMYCPINYSCELFDSNATAGGILSLSPDDMVEKKFELEGLAKSVKYMLDQINDHIMKDAAEKDELEWVTEDGNYSVGITVARRRSVDASLVASAIGPERFSKLGSITLTEVDNLLKDESLSPDQRQQIQASISKTTGSPRLKVTKIERF